MISRVSYVVILTKKGIGEANVILGIMLSRSIFGITLSQFHYTENLDYKPTITPDDPGVHLEKNKGKFVD